MLDKLLNLVFLEKGSFLKLTCLHLAFGIHKLPNLNPLLSYLYKQHMQLPYDSSLKTNTKPKTATILCQETSSVI